MLTRRRTLDECFVEHVACVRKGHITQAAVDQDRTQLEARWQPGDECWEWIMGKETAQADGRSGAGARRPNRLGAQRLDPLTRHGLTCRGPSWLRAGIMAEDHPGDLFAYFSIS